MPQGGNQSCQITQLKLKAKGAVLPDRVKIKLKRGLRKRDGTVQTVAGKSNRIFSDRHTAALGHIVFLVLDDRAAAFLRCHLRSPSTGRDRIGRRPGYVKYRVGQGDGAYVARQVLVHDELQGQLGAGITVQRLPVETETFRFVKVLCRPRR